jgi:hypothetical protein
MNTRRLERFAILLVLLGTACTLLPRPHTPVHAETRLVTIPGEAADTLAETTGPVEDALVPVHTHDGRDLWVRDATLGGAMLVPGTSVIVRYQDHATTASVSRSLDAFVEVDIGGSSAILPIGDVLARMHRVAAPTVAPPTDPAVVTPPPPPPTPLAQMVTLETTHLLHAASIASCTAGTAHVVLADGTETDALLADVHPMRVRAGDRVSALWNGSPYPAFVTAVRGSLVHVRWEDASEQWIDLTDVQSVEGTSGVAVQGCPHRTVLVDEGARVAVGRLLACDGERATVLGADGTPRTVTRDSLSRVPLRIGDAIEARWNGSPYEATVLSIGDRLHIRWYDSSEADVDPADLVTFRAHDGRATEAASCPHAG